MASSSRLKPGEAGKINVSLDITGKSGPVTKTAQVFTNDPTTPIVSLQVRVFVRPLR